MEEITLEAQYVLQFINQTNRSIFLTGKAGTGKTTLLKTILQTTHKNTVVVAPTGIAALNATGVTIHSLFQFPFGGFLPVPHSAAPFTDNLHFQTQDTLVKNLKINGLKKAILQQLELLVIDEVSMLRPDLLDAIDTTLRSVRKNNRVFGGAQLLFIGDLLQLPPVIKEEEWRIMSNYYQGKFFFHAHALQQEPPLYLELSKIFRQKDDRFIALLNNLRNNSITREDFNWLNGYVRPDFDLKAHPGYIILTTHNAKADAINRESLEHLPEKPFVFYPEITGHFPEKSFPLEEKLILKKGAQVIFTKNDLSYEKQYYNGKMGVVEALSEAEIYIRFPEENKTIAVEKYEWQNIRYTLHPDTKTIEEEVLGTFVQYPLKLAWAITIHKSQGLTFDKAALDVSQVFLPGQAYVALSRLRHPDGLVLLAPMQMSNIDNDQQVMRYGEDQPDPSALPELLEKSTRSYLLSYLQSSFDWTELHLHWQQQQESPKRKKKLSSQNPYSLWVKSQTAVLEQLLEPASKFRAQLQKLFNANTDLEFVHNRVEAAFAYFFPVLDQLTDALYTQLEQLQNATKGKSIFEALLAVEELQTAAIMRLMKARLLSEAVAKKLPFSKASFTSKAIQEYRPAKLSQIRANLSSTGRAQADGATPGYLETPNRKKKMGGRQKEKKPTHLQTYELWLQGLPLNEIAQTRKLTPQTITTHLAQLVASQTISLTQLMAQETIEALEVVFKDNKHATLGQIKEICGETFSWDELKLFKASL